MGYVLLAEHLLSVRTERKVAGAMVLVMRSRGLLRSVGIGLGRDADEASCRLELLSHAC